MKKHVYFIIRFSVIQPSSAAWNSSTLSLTEMANNIFQESRLDFRFKTLKNICLASIADQKIHDADSSFTVLLLTSDALPDKYKNELKIIQNEFNKNSHRGNFDIAFIHSSLIPSQADGYKNMNEAIKAKIATMSANDCLFATVRLDDDDAIYESYLEKLTGLMNKSTIGMCVSFPYGIEGYINSSSFSISDLRHSYFPKIAIGLAYINSIQDSDLVEKKVIHVLNTNNHTKVDERFPVIMDARFPMYFRSLSSNNDSQGSPQHKNLPKVNGNNTINGIPCIHSMLTDHLHEENEDPLELEISKTASPASALIAHLNNQLSIYRKK
ncbi:Uncharacterized protein ChrSV_0616 [Chromobacterium vaccinii]|uniref:glycosyltransferase n=1 Tax=Chromobacterium TaxID=535 RepID=UPI000B0B6116|nr:MULTISPECIES: glycosyltransferase [Chromobacterium]QND82844.1 Uncharacterized protein ChrSW_0616 [Chromobacterium vaccinii]QND88075.1 Uncharacterized protein ChrSV_0616 [Chromobacterium vaccinii]